jgi:hypothetical protein
MQVFLKRCKYISVRRVSVTLLVLNIISAMVYVYAAMPSWVIPEERAQGLYTVTGEPVVWAVRALPILAGFVLINIIWGAYICAKRKWRSSFLWLSAVLVWLVAIWVDFSHH